METIAAPAPSCNMDKELEKSEEAHVAIAQRRTEKETGRAGLMLAAGSMLQWRCQAACLEGPLGEIG